MKKIFKLMNATLASAMFLGLGANLPTLKEVKAETPAEESISAISSVENAAALAVSKIPSKINAGEDFIIPIPAVKTGNTVSIIVKDRSGETYTYTVGASENPSYFELVSTGVKVRSITNGNYSVKYKITDGENSYYSTSHKVVVSGASYKLDFSNATEILPAKSSVGNVFVLPTAQVKDSNDNYLTNADIKISVSFNGKNLALAEDGMFYTEDGKFMLRTDKEGSYVVNYKYQGANIASKSFTIKADSNFDASKINLNLGTMSMPSCEIGVETTFPSANVTDSFYNTTLKSTEYNVVIKVYDADYKTLISTLDTNEFKYTFTATGEYRIEYNITDAYGNTAKKAYILNKVTHKNAPEVHFAEDYTTGATDYVDALYRVPTSIGYNSITLPAIYAKDAGTVDTSKLTFSRVLKSATNSSIRYNIDSTADNAALSEDYEADYTKAVPFKFKQRENESTQDYIERISGEWYILYTCTDEAGNIGYAYSKSGLKFTVADVDAESYTKNTNLKVELSDISVQLDLVNGTTVKAPTITDDRDKRFEEHMYYSYATEASIKSILEGLKGGAEYNSNWAEAIASLDLHEISKNKDNSNLYDLKLGSEYAGQANVTLLAVGIEDQGHFAYDMKTLEVKNTSETEAPIVESIADTFASQLNGRMAFDQAEEITLPTVTFYDKIDKSLAVSVSYYINEPTNADGLDVYYDCASVSYSYKDVSGYNATTIMGGKLTTSKVGTYYVVFTATDDAGNVCEVVKSFKVVDNTKPTLDVKTFNTSIKTGNVIDFEYSLKDSSGNTITNLKEKRVSVSGNAKLSGDGENSYIFTTAGTYNVEIYASYINDNGVELSDTKTFTVVVTNPELKWDNSEFDIPSYEVKSEVKQDTYHMLTQEPEDWDTNFANYFTKSGETYSPVSGTEAPEFQQGTYHRLVKALRVELPIYTASQEGFDVVTKLTVKTPSGAEVELTEIRDDNDVLIGYSFVPYYDGTYKITYTATSSSGDVLTSKDLTILVGDNVAPTFTIDTAKLDTKITYTDDISYKISISDLVSSDNNENVYTMRITATSNGKEIYSYDKTIKLFDTDEDGNKTTVSKSNLTITLTGDNVTSNGSNSWTITGVGTYTVTATLKDSNGNTTPVSWKFEVVSKANKKSISDSKVGTILIIISLIVLAGVICFFAFTGNNAIRFNRKPKNTKTEDTSSNEESKEDKE